MCVCVFAHWYYWFTFTRTVFSCTLQKRKYVTTTKLDYSVWWSLYMLVRNIENNLLLRLIKIKMNCGKAEGSFGSLSVIWTVRLATKPLEG